MGNGKNVYATIADKLASLRDQAAAKGSEEELVYGIQADYFRRAARAKERGELIAWLNFCPPPELFWAMDVVPVYVEGTFRILSLGSPEDVCRYIDLAEQHIPDYVCSSDKATLGAALAGDIPLPDIIVHSSHPCDSALATFPQMAEYFGIPHFCIDVPYWSGDRAYRYLEDELWDLVAFLEDKTKRKLDPDKLKQVARYSSEAHKYILKYNELRRAIPCPLSGKDLIQDRSTFRRTAGTPELVDYVKKRYELTREKVAKKQGAIAQEKIRLMWAHAMPPDPGLYQWLEEKYGAVSIIEMMSNSAIQPIEDPSDISSIFRGLAGKTMNMPMGRESRGPWEYYGDVLIEACREYKADAAVWAGHVGCKNAWGISKLLKDKMEDELNLPVLMFEVDIWDARITSLEAMKAKLSDFFEIRLQR
jgi:benzoyl-CoA reductase/2-hydroxyglutaryl-CoA dehydratase subunit BcrC/BadD/HgdB